MSNRKAEPQWGDICEKVDTCALTGAGAFICSIPGAEVLVNGPLWCYFYALRYLEVAQGNLSQRFHGSQPDNNAIVYGSEKFIIEALERLNQRENYPSLLLIESSCSLSLIGDDLKGIARKANLPYPVVTMDSGGMIGGFAAGYAKAAKLVIDTAFVDTVQAQPLTVNLLGMTDYYLHSKADNAEIVRLLTKAGYVVNAMPGAGATIEEIGRLGQASLNIVINEELGLAVAKHLEEKYGMPYVCAGVPYGKEGTMAWLRRIDAVLPAPSLDDVQQEATQLNSRLQTFVGEARLQWGNMWFDNVLVSAPPTVALCLAQALRNEWLDMGNLKVVCQSALPSGDAARYCDCADAIDVKNSAQGMVVDALQQTESSLLLLASSSEGQLLYRQNHHDFSNINIAYPSKDEVLLADVPYVGLKGAAFFLQKLWNMFIIKHLYGQK